MSAARSVSARDADARVAFLDEERRLTARAVRNTVLGTVAILPPLLVLDRLHVTWAFGDIVAIRMLHCLVLLAVAGWACSAWGRRRPEVVATAASMVTTAAVCATMHVSGGHGSPHAAGLSLILLALVMLLPLSVRGAFAVVVAVVLVYVGYAVGVPSGGAERIGENVVALSMVGAVAVGMALPRRRLRWQEFRSRWRAAAADAARAATAERLREETALASALVRAGDAMMAVVDTPQVLERVCTLATELVGCDAAEIALVQPDGSATFVAGHGDPPAIAAALHGLRVAEPTVGAVVRRLDVDDVAAIGRDDVRGLVPPPVFAALQAEAVLCVALRRGEATAGGLVLLQRRPGATFGPRDVRVARGVAQIAALAIANAQLVEELGRASALKSVFVSTMSHELRAPLGVLLGLAEMAADDGCPMDERERLLAGVRRSATTLLSLIEDTMEAGQLDAPDAVRQEPTSLPALWSALRTACEPLPPAPDVRVEWTDPVPGVPVVTDRRKLQLVVRNLVGNALKFTEHGTVAVDVDVLGDRWRLRVRDTGCGIPDTERESIFQLFQRGDVSRVGRRSGVGLGLYIVARLVEQLGGTVALDSVVGEGSTFTITLPRVAERERAASAA